MAKTVFTILTRLLLVAAALILILRLVENRFVFHPTRIAASEMPPVIPGAQMEQHWLESQDGIRLDAWYMTPSPPPAGPAPVLILFHGNGGSLFDQPANISRFIKLGWNVLALDYRGYGRSEGHPTEGGLYLDAQSAYDFLVQKKQTDPRILILFGESLGTAVAIRLASDNPCAGLILESPWSSFYDMGHTVYPFIPRFVYYFLNNQWNSADLIQKLGAPKLIIQGDRDNIVPYDMAYRMYVIAQPPKWFVPIKGAGHLECFSVGGVKLENRVREFVDESLRLSRALPLPAKPR
ncbi:MAG: alpha/beta hydrolase [Acidobacteriia bacterium]|nr:alpha/beta hydrolase [Terriglobia bacterium]